SGRELNEIAIRRCPGSGGGESGLEPFAAIQGLVPHSVKRGPIHAHFVAFRFGSHELKVWAATWPTLQGPAERELRRRREGAVEFFGRAVGTARQLIPRAWFHSLGQKDFRLWLA